MFKSQWSSIFLIFWLVACQPTNATDSLPFQAELTATPLNSHLPVPTEGEKEVATLVATPELAPSPTTISEPLLVAANDGVFELPEWVKDHDSDLILFTYDDTENQSSKFGFINPETGEKIILKLSHWIYYYYWKDSKNIVFLQEGYCEESPRFVTELDISTGILKEFLVKDYPESIRSCYPTIDTENDVAKLNRDLSEPTIEVLDFTTGQYVRLTNPNDGISDIRYGVSPDKEFIAVVQFMGEFDFPELAQPLFGNQISIYDFQERKLLQTFDVGQKVSTELLFTYNGDLIYKRENTPCVIEFTELSKNCIHNIPSRFPTATILLGESYSDPSRISFLYFVDQPHHGGFCFYFLFSGDIVCPTDQFKNMDEQTIIRYSLSPDNKYLLFIYDYKGCPPYWCDYAGDPQLGVIDIDGNQFFEIGSSEVYKALNNFRVSQPWRPKP